ncbi:hypothetical protein CMUS01_06771 [Colletotrichum musicola]|uniref:Uncharacterized protein n=1 Tax=Colletotrichum musicola TaxID=2175873 RepID=A0A8H6KKL0_9PEZI|nr:hypothetical protein CMUS01_06771 [Colletotrichum musicola]
MAVVVVPLAGQKYLSCPLAALVADAVGSRRVCWSDVASGDDDGANHLMSWKPAKCASSIFRIELVGRNKASTCFSPSEQKLRTTVGMFASYWAFSPLSAAAS